MMVWEVVKFVSGSVSFDIGSKVFVVLGDESQLLIELGARFTLSRP